LVNKDSNLLTQITKETNTIQTLNTQLAAATKPATQAAIQKKITAATALQTKLSTQQTASHTSADTALDTVEALEATMTTAIAAVPAASATLTASFTTVPTTVKPGKKSPAILSVTNTGNVLASASFQVALSARPLGTDGSADIPLATITMHVHINPSLSTPQHLNIPIPATLPAGTYTLVADPVPNNTFIGLPTAVVSLQTFTTT
jgi:hypothetical protein